MRILAVCGYKRHGKDSFVADLIAVSRGRSPVYSWAVFSLRGSIPLSVCPKARHVSSACPEAKTPSSVCPKVRHLSVCADSRHISFAARLKKQVHNSLGLPDEYEPVDKDALMLTRDVSFRDLYKQEAAKMTAANPHHWADAALKDVPAETTQALVSDFRFPAELESMRAVDPDVVTARVFYAHAAIPDALDTTEHSLDFLTTDFLALPLEDLHRHREAVLDVLPQYRCFTFHMTVC